MWSRPQTFVRTLLVLSLLSILALITLGMSGSLSTAMPALSIFVSLAVAYGAYRLVRTWNVVRPAA